MTLNVTARNTIVRWPTATIEHTSYLMMKCWLGMGGGAFDINVVLPPEVARATLF
jgi:hypothetical protein